ncbi:MAG: hypothetical protein JJU26_13435 [Oceanicaulis sp.]|nr:hypothetical protein [Oceanicaulis sp.]
MRYVKSKREKKSICNLCRETKDLSWDHVPPRGGIELTRVEMRSILNLMAGGQDEPKASESQNGVKYRTLCSDCNSFLGREFDPVLNEFAQSVGGYLKSALELPSKISHKVKLQRLMKGVIGHLIAAKIPIEDTVFDLAGREYVLDLEADFPDGIGFFYWTYPYDTSICIREFVMFTPRGTYDAPAVFQLLKYAPVAYLCSTAEDYADLPKLTSFRGAALDDEVELQIDLERVERPYWPEAPSDKDGNVFFGGESATGGIHAKPR